MELGKLVITSSKQNWFCIQCYITLVHKLMMMNQTVVHGVTLQKTVTWTTVYRTFFASNAPEVWPLCHGTFCIEKYHSGNHYLCVYICSTYKVHLLWDRHRRI